MSSQQKITDTKEAKLPELQSEKKKNPKPKKESKYRFRKPKDSNAALQMIKPI